MTDKRIVLSTAGSEEEARRIANYLVENRLAACVNVLSQVNSIYRWQDKVESAWEWLLIAKTTDEKSAKVCDAIRGLHSYEVPECIILPIQHGSSSYLDWIGECVK
jgi:periplasmic divalent cation tolerance protein